MAEYLWLILSVVLFAVEALTYTLVCIWFAIGAAAAMVAAFCGADVLWQWVIFAAVSAVLLLCTRNAAKKWLMPKKIEKTNADSLIGESGVVTERIDNLNAAGRIKVHGQSWRAKSEDDSIIEVGETVVVTALSGVTLTVRKKD
ncbi:MAG TPA: NfeD family protein [Candidatus Aphodoplasma excrementigallinarum]|uniref:NfeD family protein n=1 Tax=Candidatus Aphodoplasma excrementigallinarum TaxID=2840673 RepID=A0A9D1NF19_9FIRM|nr:NfeD family protein [Candidatus Aphodoplasma excrementigallinarum]